MASRLLPLTLFALCGGCRSILGIEEGVVANGKVDAANEDIIPNVDAPDDAPIDAAAPWWDPTFGSRRSITFATTGLTLPLMNLPVLVRIPSAVVAELRPAGADIRFVADDHATVLTYEIDAAATNEITCWVKLSLTVPDQRIWLYYNNATSTAQSNGVAVFGVDYESVHHLQSNTDSTGNAHNTGAGGPSTPVGLDALIGRGMQFDGVNDYLSLANSDGAFDFTEEMSVSAWFKTGNFTIDYQPIVTKGDTAWRVQRDAASNKVTFATGSGSNTDNVVGTSGVEDNNWHHILVTRDLNTKSLYLDGVLEGTKNNPPPLPMNGSFVRIGGNETATARSWNGLIDEVRISATPRTAAWAKAEFQMASPTFSTFGAREMKP